MNNQMLTNNGKRGGSLLAGSKLTPAHFSGC